MKTCRFVSACAIVAIAGSAVNAQSIDWLSAVDGDWATAANWAGSDVPDTISEIAVLGLSGAYTVTSTNPRTVGGIQITNPDAMLSFGTVTHSLFGPVMNDGLITLNFNASVFNSAMNFEDNATISGTGSIRMLTGSNTDDSQINSGFGFIVTNGFGHSILGSGQLGGEMRNNGDIIADDPGGAGLRLNGTMVQNPTGRAGADGGVLLLGNGSDTSGGLLFSENGGEIRVSSNTATIGALENTGDMTIFGGGNTLALSSTIDNNGSISINSNTNIFNAHLRFDATAEIAGTGTIGMDMGSGDQSDAQIYTNGVFTGTIGSGQVVQGSGLIDGRSGGTIVNNGTVIANDPIDVLGLSGMHGAGSGEYRAEGDGVLGLNNNALLSGVTFNSSGDGTVDVIGSVATVNSATNLGTMGVRGDGRTLALTGPLTNNGTINVNNNENIFNAHIRFDASTQIDGTGTINMDMSTTDNGDAQIYTSGIFDGTIGSGQLVQGSGLIDGRNDGTIINNGVFNGNDPEFDLRLAGNHNGTGGGVYRADDGVVGLNAGLVLDGGTFDSSGTGEVNKITNGVATISNITNNGTMGVRGAGGFINLAGDLTNNGSCLINSDLNIFNAHIQAVDDVTIDGTGTVRMQMAGSDVNDAQLFTGGVFDLTIGPDQTVAGSGRVDGASGGTIVNLGTINGDDPVFELRLFGNHDGSAGGVYRSDDGVLGLNNGAVISGGTFDSSGIGMVAKTTGGTATISGMTNEGQLNIWGSGGFIDLAGDLTNNGEIWINSDSNVFNAHLRFVDSFAINGTGTIRMTTAGSAGDAQLIAADPLVGTIGAGQTLIGDGLLDGTYNIDGTLDPDGPTRAFTADNISLSDSSHMIVDLGGANIGEFDRVVLSNGDVFEIDGTLTVNIDPGYVPAFGDTWDIITGGTTTGIFDEVITGDAPFGQVYRVIYAVDRVYVILTCDGDLTGDGGIDFFDVSIFLNFFSSEDVRGDLNNDGVFNFFDVSLFLQIFGQGCNP